MLTIIIEGHEVFDEETQTFEGTQEDTVLEFEHSLASLSKWESKHQRPFLSDDKKTAEETLDYMWFMLLTPNIDRKFLYGCSAENLHDIQSYIQSTQSATTFGDMPNRSGPAEVITSELIYYWLVAFNIPFDCETWHLNRLFALIRICNAKNGKQKKMSKHEVASRNRDLNAQRKQKYGTNG